MKKKKNIRSSHHSKSSQIKSSNFIIYLFFSVLLLLGLVALVQQNQDVRQFAIDLNPTPTIISFDDPTPTIVQIDPTPTVFSEETPTQPIIPTTQSTNTPFPTHTTIPSSTSTIELPNPTNTPSVSPTPIYRCNTGCSSNSQCPTGLFCSAGKCRHPSCKDETDCSCPIIITPKPRAPTTAVVKKINTITPTNTPTVRVVPSTVIVSTLQPTDVPFIFPTIQPYTPPTQKSTLLDAIVIFFAEALCNLFRCKN